MSSTLTPTTITPSTGVGSVYHSTININTAGGGGTRTITFTNRGLYYVFIGANYNDVNLSTTLLVTHSGSAQVARVLTINNPGFSVTVNGTTGGFTISATYPSNYNGFDVSYVYFAF
jgi:hypothetical protein